MITLINIIKWIYFKKEFCLGLKLRLKLHLSRLNLRLCWSYIFASSVTSLVCQANAKQLSPRCHTLRIYFTTWTQMIFTVRGKKETFYNKLHPTRAWRYARKRLELDLKLDTRQVCVVSENLLVVVYFCHFYFCIWHVAYTTFLCKLKFHMVTFMRVHDDRYHDPPAFEGQRGPDHRCFNYHWYPHRHLVPYAKRVMCVYVAA